MRRALLYLGSLAVAACRSETANPVPEGMTVAGSLRYEATTLTGEPLLTGCMDITVLPDSTIQGTWSTQWAAGADTMVEVGDQVGSGRLSGRLTEAGAHIDLNPGYADNNVILLAAPAGNGFAGTWEWSTFAGPRSRGRFSAVRD